MGDLGYLKTLCMRMACYCGSPGLAGFETSMAALHNYFAADGSPASAVRAADQAAGDAADAELKARGIEFHEDGGSIPGDGSNQLLKDLCVRMAYYCDHPHFDGCDITHDELRRLMVGDDDSDAGPDDSLVVEIDTTGYSGPEDLEPGQGQALLPGWLTERMMHDEWVFGLITDAGLCLCIQSIDRVWQAADGTVWLDVTFMDHPPIESALWAGLKMVAAPTERLAGSINSDHIVAALELADT